MTLYFVTMNDYKPKEVTEYLSGTGIGLSVVRYPIQEILNLDMEVIVRDKVLKAYQYLGRPCVVEHGGLLIAGLKGLPGGLSKVVWDTVGDQICTFLQPGTSRAAVARSVIGYCDGCNISIFTGDTSGTIADCQKGAYAFQWDPVFIPDGQSKTYAELGFPEKGRYSQAAKAWAKLVNHLKPAI